MKTPSPDLADKLLAVTEQVLRTEPPMRLQDIAQLVGASRATLYYYFSGREDLLAFLLSAHAEAGARAVEAATDPAAPPEHRLRASVSAMIEYLGGHPGVCAGMLGSFGDAGQMREALQANDTWILRPLRALLAEGRNSGSFILEDATDAANAVVGAVLVGVLGRAMSGADAADPHFRHGLADQITRGVLA
ncbi:TetR/AcrR family transcriptional regulator [Glycomyces sp. YM15]|uniref:TetR/AcrR family transcriptional regulator n=1 Tax=Glycomyces sp. YM15 TaxID=2800446 RepID=UPI00196553D2|nr:TetR/AcrR family transcriptional regulator [Glycomyces sp. YM15]